MITINLLAPGKRRPVGPTPGTILGIAGAALLVVLLIAIALFLGSRVASLQRQVAEVTQQIEALRPVALQVEQLRATVRQLQARQAVIQALLANQLPATESLQAIRTVIPQDVWLVNLTTSGGKGVLFDGYTFSYKAVARFMVALKDSDRFRNIDLTSTQKDKLGAREVVKFQVTGELAPMHSARTAPSALPEGDAAPRVAAQKSGDPQ
ncbi:MAG TPA: PilN domain-containing protein [bacterium]|nr:PilN domain-containing protein [bacterium]